MIMKPHQQLTRIQKHHANNKKCMRLNEIMKELRFSFREMAEALGIPASTFQSYADGRRRLPWAVLLRAARLRRSVNTFMTGLPARVDARIAVEYPHGIQSEIIDSE